MKTLFKTLLANTPAISQEYLDAIKDMKKDLTGIVAGKSKRLFFISEDEGGVIFEVWDHQLDSLSKHYVASKEQDADFPKLKLKA